MAHLRALVPVTFGVLVIAIGALQSVSAAPSIGRPSFQISCLPASVHPHEVSQCSASIRGSGKVYPGIVWSASSGSISSSGLFVAPDVSTSSYISIRGTSARNSADFATASILVMANPPAFSPIPGVTSHTLGQIIPSINLASYVHGGQGAINFAIASQSSPGVVNASILGNRLVFGYTYRAGTSVITIEATDIRRLTATTSIQVRVAPPQMAYRVFGMDYSPYEGTQDPGLGSDISEEQIVSSLGLLTPYVRNVRTYGVDHGLDKVGCIAHKFGLGAWIEAWISDIPADPNNAAQVQTLIDLAKSGCVDVAIIGSEVLQRGAIPTPNTILTGFMNQFRAAVPGIPVTTADTWPMLLLYSDVTTDSDLILADIHPYWESQDISKAVFDLNVDDRELRNRFPGKEVIIAETGWPSDGQPNGDAVPSLVNGANYFVNFESWARANNRRSFYFEFRDEPWKLAIEPFQVGSSWGLFAGNNHLKYGADGFNGVTVPNNWACPDTPGGPGDPSVELTYVPPKGAMGGNAILTGSVAHANPSEYFIVVYIHIGSSGWWPKPYIAWPLTPIQCDGTWATATDTGGVDYLAYQMCAFLIPDSYTPIAYRGILTLPADLLSHPSACANR